MWLRTASREDLEDVSAMLTDTWHQTYDSIYGREKVAELTRAWHSVDALKQRLTRPQSEFILADDGAEIAGMAYASQTDQTRAMLHQLYVRPSMQGRGVGKMLLVEIESSFPNVRRFRIEVEEANSSAVAFYTANGYVVAGETPDCGVRGSGIPAIIMEKSIW